MVTDDTSKCSLERLTAAALGTLATEGMEHGAGGHEWQKSWRL